MRAAIAFFALILAGCGSNRPGSLAPAEAAKSFRLSEDFRIELFAAEPDIVDPVDMVFDDRGRAYVAEMLDLPWDPPKGRKARGRIRMLEDTNGDGKADRSVIFAEDVLQVSGLMPWKGGFIVPAAPEILYLKDTDGDGRADVREVWFTGFYQGNPEGQITNPRLAIDNWIYFSNAGNEGLIRSPKHPEQPPVQVRGADLRYHPVRGVFETASGPAQFGSTFDDWGNRFISQNTLHLRHVVVPMEYLRRAPLLEPPPILHDVYNGFERKMYPLTGPQEWRVERTKLRQARYDELKNGRIEHAAGYITGAAGSTIYQGDAWPESYRGSVFTGDVSANLVRRDTMQPDGVTFLARPAKTGVEFLASTDPWFRPTCFANAPDGHLYMMDMQREFIETPLSVPEELRKKMDFYSGDTLGRVYRIAANQPRHTRGLRADLGSLSSADLVKLYEHPNGWHRATAKRLLLERQDRAAAPVLREMARKSASAVARVHALWTLEGIGELSADDVAAALDDAQPEIREHAIRLSERVKMNGAGEAKLLSKTGDPAIRVRYQLAYSAGSLPGAAAKAALVKLDVSDRWVRTAVLSSVAGWPAEYYAAAVKPDADLTRSLASLIGARNQPAEIASFVNRLPRGGQIAAGLSGLARGLRLAGARGVRAAGVEAILAKAMESPVPEEQAAAWEAARFFDLRQLVDRAAADASNAQAPVAVRVRAFGALRGAPYSRAAAVADGVLAPAAPVEVQSAAILALSSFDDAAVPRAVLKYWKNYSPEARVKAVGALLGKKERVPALLEALETGAVETAAVDVGSRSRLLESREPGIADRARKLFGAAVTGRENVVAQYKDVLALKGDESRGELVFGEHCARCHLPRRQGGRVGPDLSGINNKTREELIEAILNPSLAIESRFVNYVVTTKDGRMFDGVLASETPGSITLRGGAEEDVILLRSSIAEIRSSSISLMPEELEKGMTRQALADVIAYLRGGL